MRRVLAALATVAALAVLAGCAASGAGDTRDDGGGTADRTLDVLAAASLSETFTELADRFEADHPGVEVRLVLESSATLAGQVVEGAPGDVLATADEVTMQRVVDADIADMADIAEAPEAFATNRLVLVVPPTNPAGILSFEDLGDPAVSFVACVETAPCGALAARLLDENGVTTEPRSLEVDVKAVLAKITSDEADAGLVYTTDSFAVSSEVTTFPIPGSEDALTTYPIAVLEQADEPELAAEWVELVLSEEGQTVLADAGFGPPGA